MRRPALQPPSRASLTTGMLPRSRRNAWRQPCLPATLRALRQATSPPPVGTSPEPRTTAQQGRARRRFWPRSARGCPFRPTRGLRTGVAPPPLPRRRPGPPQLAGSRQRGVEKERGTRGSPRYPPWLPSGTSPLPRPPRPSTRPRRAERPRSASLGPPAASRTPHFPPLQKGPRRRTLMTLGIPGRRRTCARFPRPQPHPPKASFRPPRRAAPAARSAPERAGTPMTPTAHRSSFPQRKGPKTSVA